MTDAPRPLVVVVDDSPTVRSIVKVHLTGTRALVKEAESAEAALKMLDDEPVKLMIVDWHMPGMDGIEMLKKIRSSSRPEVRDVPVIMLSGDLKLNASSVPGVQAIVHKPVSKSGLVDAVARLLG